MACDVASVAIFLAAEITQVTDSIPWVLCSSGNVYKYCSIKIIFIYNRNTLYLCFQPFLDADIAAELLNAVWFGVLNPFLLILLENEMWVMWINIELSVFKEKERDKRRFNPSYKYTTWQKDFWI